MPITKQLLQQGRSAHAHYAMCLEKEQKEKQEAQKQLTLLREQALQMEAQKQQLSKEKNDLQCEEKESERQERAQQDSMEVGDTILKEANAKLQAALKNKDFKEVSCSRLKRRSVLLTHGCSRQGSNGDLFLKESKA